MSRRGGAEGGDIGRILLAVELGDRHRAVIEQRVNNRNLKDFSVDFSNAARLRELVPPECVYVAESGVSSTEDVAALKKAGADAVLMGEVSTRAARPRLWASSRYRARVAVSSRAQMSSTASAPMAQDRERFQDIE